MSVPLYLMTLSAVFALRSDTLGFALSLYLWAWLAFAVELIRRAT